MGRVVVLGSLSQDLHLEVERHPGPGETVIADGGLVVRRGGKGANQAVAVASAGADVLMVGRVGDDEPARAYRERLDGLGVDVSWLRTDGSAPTGTAVVVTDAEGENVIVVAPGANGRVSEQDLDGVGALGPGDVLLAPLEVPPGLGHTPDSHAAAPGSAPGSGPPPGPGRGTRPRTGRAARCSSAPSRSWSAGQDWAEQQPAGRG